MEKKFFSRNSAERTGHPYAKKKIAMNLHNLKTLIQDGSQTYM